MPYVIHRVEDVTEFVRLKQQGTEQTKLIEELRSRAEQMESEIYLRARELDDATRQLRRADEELAIVGDFTQLHGGALGVGDAPEGGALLRAEVPRQAPEGAHVVAMAAEEAVVTEAARHSIEALRSRTAARPMAAGKEGRALIVVVEDHPEMNAFICETLADRYRVESAFDGREGLEKVLELRPDLVLSDVMMPEMSGETLVREIRARSELDEMPIVVLTAKGDDALRVELLREGAQDYVTKPFSAEELRARVANLVTMKRARDVLQHALASQLRDLQALAEEIAARKRDLQTALDTARVARDHAEAASRVKSNFLGLVSHELRNPLTVIQTNLHLLKREASAAPPSMQQMLGRIGNSTARLMHTPGVGLGLSLVREMLDAIGGRVELSSTVGVGSTFTVLLPSTATLRASGRLKTAV